VRLFFASVGHLPPSNDADDRRRCVAIAVHSLLDQLKVFTAFYRISELRSRDDLVKAILLNIDYTLFGPFFSSLISTPR
jgi:hypothetical protein